MSSRTSERPQVEPPVPPPIRAWPGAVGFGLLAGALTGFALIGLIAAPLFLWAMATEPATGLQRPAVRSGLRLAPVLGFLAFLVTAALCTLWRRRHPAAANGPA